MKKSMYRFGKASRTEVQHGQERCDYLRWKSDWWASEFERLQKATGLRLNFPSQGETLDTAPIEEMMMRYGKQVRDHAPSQPAAPDHEAHLTCLGHHGSGLPDSRACVVLDSRAFWPIASSLCTRQRRPPIAPHSSDF